MTGLKLYILVRDDLDVSIGKLMVHVGHICTKIVYYYSRNRFIEVWMDDFHRIIILKVKNLDELKKYYYRWWDKHNRSSVMIEDAGFYEVPKGTILMCGIGPIFENEAKNLGLKKLRLFKK